MISLHQLFRVLSRVSVDPSAPFCPPSLHSPVAGIPRGVGASRVSKEPCSPLKAQQPASDSSLITTCTSSPPAQCASSSAVCGLEESLFDEAECTPFSFSSSTNTTAKPLAIAVSSTRQSSLCSSSSSSTAGSPLTAPSFDASSPGSACTVAWSSLPSERTLRSSERPLPSLALDGVGAPLAIQALPHGHQVPHKELGPQFFDSTASSITLLDAQGGVEEDSRGSAYRATRRQRRKLWPQEAPWDSGTCSRAAAGTSEIAWMQRRAQDRIQTRGGAAIAQQHCPLPEKSTDVLSVSGQDSRSSRRRSVASRGHQQVNSAVATVPQGDSMCVPIIQGGPGTCLVGISEGPSRLPGVCFSPPKDVWRARITVEGKQFEQQFSVKRHGYDGARILAVRWRAEMEHARIVRPLAHP
ncbi:uncharacterized protein LOC34618106 [Cyclospora cayetanensis]|uniref:Uncharacterized protein LOC34618106 n=1 Tax=Cyclospora cayetanensis TaxID=88456 RepID=A0A6P6RSC9_9EIME|nr:uncharacterized protein LOC34618106 [Cyclospora cayetanensis]